MMEATPHSMVPAAGRRLRLLSYNVQMGISSSRPHHYLTNLWKHVLPASCRFRNLDAVAQLIADFDIVALQELDAGSHRTGYVHLTEYLAQKAGFPFWHHQLNRNLGQIAQHGNGLLSRTLPSAVTEHRLPGMMPGRGALLVRYGHGDNALAVVLIHLALGQRSRLLQLDFVSELLADYRHAVLMGDMNCAPGSPEMRRLFQRSRLCEPEEERHTFPSWRPNRSIDHILVTPELGVASCHVVNHACSDHLPVAMELILPDDIHLPA